MTDIVDEMLARLAGAPVHPGLAFTEGAILDRIGKPEVPVFGLSLASMAVAVLMGFASAGMNTPAQASPLFALSSIAALAPSNLLVGAR